MSDKDFKVKNKLIVNGLDNTSGVILATNNQLDSHTLLPTQYGGTGTTTSPSSGQILYSTSGATYAPTDLSSLVIPTTFSNDAPSSPVTGQVWIEADSDATSFDPNIIRRQVFTATAGQTEFTTTVPFIDTYEQVFYNGVLILRTTDYTTSNSNTITLVSAAAVNDIIEVLTVTNLNSVNTYTQAEIESGYVSKSGGSTVTAGSASTKGLILKGATSQTANLQEWQNSAGSTRLAVSSYGTLISYTEAIFNNTLNGTGTALLVKTNNAGGKPLVVQGAASQTADLQQWQNSSGTVKGYVNPSGDASFGSISAGYYTPYSGAFSANALLYVNTNAVSNRGIVVDGWPSQTADLQQWRNSSGTILSAVNASGGLELNGKDVEIMNIMGAY